jgi:hypothetical protein
MTVRTRPLAFGLLLTGLSVPIADLAKERTASAGDLQGALWTDPGDIASRNLYYGPGGPDNQPHAPYTFVKEDLDGSSPKFDVRDRDGVKWKVKLGVEARPETAATRLVWAVGYFANEDYYVADLRVENMPAHLHRGQDLIAPDGSMHGRLKREDEKKVSDWAWRNSPFKNTREWNGLRVLMAVINNWDLKDDNNAIYKQKGKDKSGDKEAPAQYAVKDLGGSFGTNSVTVPLSRAKGDLDAYSHAKFIRRVTPTTVDFYVPGRPPLLFAFDPFEYAHRVHMEWIGKDVPIADVRWISGLLSQLSSQQIHDMFRAAGYSPEEVQGFSEIVIRRIAELSQL